MVVRNRITIIYGRSIGDDPTHGLGSFAGRGGLCRGQGGLESVESSLCGEDQSAPPFPREGHRRQGGLIMNSDIPRAITSDEIAATAKQNAALL